MYRKPQNTIHTNILYNSGGIGDHIAALPTSKYIYDHHPHVIQYLWVPDFFLDFAKASLPNDKQKLIIRPFSQQKKYNENFYTRTLHGHVHTSLGTHLVDHAFHVLVNQQVDDKHKNYLKPDLTNVDVTRFNLPDKFVVITTGFTAPVRELLPEYVNQLSDYVLSRGYTPVYLGKEEAHNGDKHVIKGTFKTEIDYSKGISLINQTTLLESAKVISEAKALVGLDNGLTHVGGCTDTPLIIGYTTVDPKHRLPYRYDQLGWNCYLVTLTPQELACIHCQDNMQFTYDFQFTGCFYKDTLCTKLLNADKYIKELDKVL